MTRIVLYVRESGRLKPDYSLLMDLPEVPKIGSYIFQFKCQTIRGLGARI